MNKQRHARLIAIMNNIERIQEEPNNNLDNEKHQGDNDGMAVLTSDAVITKTYECFDSIEQHQGENNALATIPSITVPTHEYPLRKLKKTINYFEENEKNEDFSPDVSEYLPSPERMKILQQRESPLSIGGNSDYIETASQNIIKTPSTISNISLALNTLDFIASPSQIYIANQLIDTPTTPSEYVLKQPWRYKTESSSKKCLSIMFQDVNQPSISNISHAIENHDTEEGGEPSLIDLDATLQLENISDSLLSDKTIMNEIIITSHQNLTQAGQNDNGADNDYDREEPVEKDRVGEEIVEEQVETEQTEGVQVEEGQTGEEQVREKQIGGEEFEEGQEVEEQIETEQIMEKVQVEEEQIEGGQTEEERVREKVIEREEFGEEQGVEEQVRQEQVEEEQNVEELMQKKNTRKRKQNFNERQDVKNKKLKNLGEAYTSCRSKKVNDKKILKPVCKCTKKCSERITNEQREYIMQQYYKIGDHEKQWQYIVNHTLAQDVKRVTVERKRTRTQSITYFLTIDSKKEQVCKTFFINTLSISHQTVYTALEKSKPGENFVDNRGRHENRPRKMPIATEKSIIQHIQLFPTVESHYTRKDSTRQYLSELLNISKMYRLYMDWFKQQRFDFPLATKRQYETIFNTNFNYSFFKPKKDQCSQCTRYRQADPKTQEELQEKYDNHQNNKNSVRQIKKLEKESVNPSETTVAVFDLEKVLSIPQSEVGSFHYKRKYPVYNFTVYDATNSTGYCYVWHGQIAKRGANEIGSCLWQFILSEKQRGIQNISFYSDGCCGQNKNRFIFALYIYAAQKLQLNITHRFFETGHGQSEGDSMHSNIERELKNRVVYTPDQMYTIITNAKVNGNKYQVKEMTQTEFYNIKELIDNKNWLKNEENQKISWTKIMEVNVSHSNPSILKYRYNFDSVFSQLNTSPVRRIRSKRGACQLPRSSEPGLETLYTEPIPISKALYDDLISLCKAGDIPSYYHGFYESMTYDRNVVCPGSASEDDEDHHD